MSEIHPAPAPPDPAITRAERRLARLERLSEMALAQAEAVKADGSAESAEAFAKFSRACRLTITLEAKLDDALGARLAGETAPLFPAWAKARAGVAGKGTPPDPYAPLKTGRKAQAREWVRDVIDREVADPEEADTLIDALEERLLCDEAYDNIDALPPRDIVERLCADLDLKPDWSRWTGEGWLANPPFFRPLCSDFANPSRRPILADPPSPHALE